jgi:hypothetical protein
MPGCLNQELTEIQDTNGWDGKPLPARHGVTGSRRARR